MKAVLVVALAACMLSACTTMETVAFKPEAGQQAITRDGVAGLLSSAPKSMVIARPASREMAPNGRPVIVLAMGNMGELPAEFRVSDIVVQRTENGIAVERMKIKTYEELVKDEKRQQVFSAILLGVAAGANSYSASQSAYGSAHTTVSGPGGVYTANTTFTSPAARQIALARADAQNSAAIANFAEAGQSSLAGLEATVIKDNTILPGEWYGGALHILPSAKKPVAGEPKTFRITVPVGTEFHQIDVVQGAAV